MTQLLNRGWIPFKQPFDWKGRDFDTHSIDEIFTSVSEVVMTKICLSQTFLFSITIYDCVPKSSFSKYQLVALISRNRVALKPTRTFTLKLDDISSSKAVSSKGE